MIRDLLNKKQGSISFEVFPPKRDGNLANVKACVDRLAKLSPDFISVTYGASGGGAKNNTIEIAEHIKKCGIRPLAHLTATGHSQADIVSILDNLEEKNLLSVLALRGDKPIEETANNCIEDFEYASDLVKFIRHYKGNKFEICGACYPEGHIDCDCIEADIDNLQKKVESGADFLISQLFFENNIFFDYLDLIRKKNISIPIIAGIMPALNAKQIIHILSLCNAKFPKKFARILAKYEDKPEALFDAGIAFATEQIIDLLAAEIDGIHIYTMNRPEVAERIYSNISQVIM
jgi:methylenetetrahydrofolate reductase (NADPH)